MARSQRLGRDMPQIVAHRGYTANYPENSLKAFEAAVEAGANAVETDLHLSRDGVVILSHVRAIATTSIMLYWSLTFHQDDDLKRCFGVDRKIKDCDWDFLKTLRTTRVPNEPLACLYDLLKCFRRPEWKSAWLMLDIKVFNSIATREKVLTFLDSDRWWPGKPYASSCWDIWESRSWTTFSMGRQSDSWLLDGILLALVRQTPLIVDIGQVCAALPQVFPRIFHHKYWLFREILLTIPLCS